MSHENKRSTLLENKNKKMLIKIKHLFLLWISIKRYLCLSFLEFLNDRNKPMVERYFAFSAFIKVSFFSSSLFGLFLWSTLCVTCRHIFHTVAIHQVIVPRIQLNFSNYRHSNVSILTLEIRHVVNITGIVAFW